MNMPKIPDLSTMIFVFGSNTAGIHGAGAARFAAHHRGAHHSIALGPMGQSYAIPTKGVITSPLNGSDVFLKTRVGDTLPLDAIKTYVGMFLAYATAYPKLEFQVTCIGCGLAGLAHADIAPMFENEDLDNLWFDELWRPILGGTYRYWGTF